MTQSPQTTRETGSVSEHPYWGLVQRISSSTALKNSPRLLQLFRYLCERALTAPGEFISEQQIGVEVFGREPGYNSDGDTIVRTQVSHLRKKLLQYFLSDGTEEPITVEIPIGSYVPLFQPRKEPARSQKGNVNGDVAAAPGKAPSRAVARGVWIAIAALLVTCSWLAWQNWRLRAERLSAASRSPYLDHLWKQLFDNGRPTSIVTSDANAMFFSDLMERPVPLEEYRDPTYPSALLKKWVPDPSTRTLMGHFMSTYLTSSQDAIAVSRITAVGQLHKISTTEVYARDFRWEPVLNNIIFLGHRKANPWVELFDNQLNFTYEWHPEARKGLMRNRAPKPGESETYEWNVPSNTTYATLAYMPTSGGTAILIGGTDMTAVDAGSHFLCDEDAIQKLHAALGIDLTQKVPYFEALIVARRARNIAYEPQLVSVRVLEHPSAVAPQEH
jgi:hypothetical protein